MNGLVGDRIANQDVQRGDEMTLPKHNVQNRLRFGSGLVMVLALWGFLSHTQAVRADDAPLSFTNDVEPVLTKAGCSIGACHAKAGSGQNGFQLSLLGLEPRDDYEHMVKADRGRRLSIANPDQSLILKKASGQLPHGGGVRLKRDSAGYAVIRKWIEQGMPFGAASEPTLVSFEVQPGRNTVPPMGQQQLKALAHYSDGTVRDVTSTALFESNDKAMADVDTEEAVRQLTPR